MSIDSFNQEFLENTWPNPMNNREQVLGTFAAFSLTVWQEAITIQSIRSLNRGSGYGSKALDWLCALADEHDVTLNGTVEPIGKKPRLNVLQLKQWYARHGFKVKGRSICREPKRERNSGLTVSPGCRRSADGFLQRFALPS